MTPPAVVARGLVKEYRVHRREAGLAAVLRSVVRRRYDTVRAVDDVTFSIEPGERVGFLGPNGAGKTTTLKMLAGLLHPTAGEVRVAGFEPRLRDPRFLSRITLVMGQKQQLLWDLPPADTFAYNGAVFGVSRADLASRLAELDALLGIADLSKRPTRQLSLGERMKCELVAALLHRPDVLFLDEPTIGLDVSMQLTVREFIASYGARHGATTLLTSHDMGDVVALCPRVIVVDGGRIRFDGSPDALVRSVRPHKRIGLRLAGPAPRELLEKVGAVVELDAAHAVVQVPQASLRDAVAHLLASLEVTDLTVEDPPLEEVLREFFSTKPVEAP